MLQRGAAGSQLVYVGVADRAVSGEEELAQSWQAAGKLLETSRAALKCGAPAQVQLLQHPEQPQSIEEKQRSKHKLRFTKGNVLYLQQ